MKNCIFLFLLLGITSLTNAQSLIAVQNNNAPSFYTDLDDAIDNAVDGDTLFIPGKTYNLKKTINKRIHLVGTGINPNSTTTTGVTRMTWNDTPGAFIANITLSENADGGSITGILFEADNINWNINTLTGATISNFMISRCLFKDGIIGNFENTLFFQNIFDQVDINGDGLLNVFTNNVLTQRGNFENTAVRNNIFLWSTTSATSSEISAVDSLIENNIFESPFNLINNTGSQGSLRSDFRNNLNVPNGLFGTNTRVGNYPGDFDLLIIFESYSGNRNDAITFTQNFRLPDSSPYKNAGTDGTDLGIYGGIFPWKDGEAPFNPQIIFKNIQGNTDENGNLQIEIHVEAQGY